MLQETHRTCAPSATRVSIRTAVCTVMCSEPVMRAPVSGLLTPNSSRIAIRPGISCSARRISSRPNAASERSATLKSGVPSGLVKGIAELLECDEWRERLEASMARRACRRMVVSGAATGTRAPDHRRCGHCARRTAPVKLHAILLHVSTAFDCAAGTTSVVNHALRPLRRRRPRVRDHDPADAVSRGSTTSVPSSSSP